MGPSHLQLRAQLVSQRADQTKAEGGTRVERQVVAKPHAVIGYTQAHGVVVRWPTGSPARSSA